MKRLLLVLCGCAATVTALAAGGSTAAAPAVTPLVSDWQYIAAGPTPPSQAACNALALRCFNPAAMANSYDFAGLHALGHLGQGKTIAVVGSFGASTIRQDLAVFDDAFGLAQWAHATAPRANILLVTSRPPRRSACRAAADDEL